MGVTNLTIAAEEKAEAEKQAKLQAEKEEEMKKNIESVVKGEFLPNDFEPVEAEAGKMFTQEEVNKIVSDRLAKAKAKYETSISEMAQKLSDYTEDIKKREIELNDKQKRFDTIRVLTESGISPDETIIQMVMGESYDETRGKVDELIEIMQSRAKEAPRVNLLKGSDIIKEVMGLK